MLLFLSSPVAISRRVILLRPFSTAYRNQTKEKCVVIPHTSIKIFNNIQTIRQWRRRQLYNYRSIGFVPTMGAFHEGHLSLIRMAAKENAKVVVSIYLNPTQFGVNEDLDSYPKTWENDIKLLRDLDRELAADGSTFGKIAAIFAPHTSEIYPGQSFGQGAIERGSFVNVKPIDQLLEGVSRPTFFRGVATVCTKLLNIVTPDRVYFGQKDFQQLVLIKNMVKDLCIDTQVVMGETKRASDGLALSSRNLYLGTRRRKVATALINSLKVVQQQYLSGGRTREDLLEPALVFLSLIRAEQNQIGKLGVRFELGYFSLADPDTLEEINVIDEKKGAIVAGAIVMQPLESHQLNEEPGLANGPMVRLIDNIYLKSNVD